MDVMDEDVMGTSWVRESVLLARWYAAHPLGRLAVGGRKFVCILLWWNRVDFRVMMRKMP